MPVYTSGANLAAVTQRGAAQGHRANGGGYWRGGTPSTSTSTLDAHIQTPEPAGGNIVEAAAAEFTATSSLDGAGATLLAGGATLTATSTMAGAGATRITAPAVALTGTSTLGGSGVLSLSAPACAMDALSAASGAGTLTAAGGAAL